MAREVRKSKLLAQPAKSKAAASRSQVDTPWRPKSPGKSTTSISRFRRAQAMWTEASRVATQNNRSGERPTCYKTHQPQAWPLVYFATRRRDGTTSWNEAQATGHTGRVAAGGSGSAVAAHQKWQKKPANGVHCPQQSPPQYAASSPRLGANSSKEREREREIENTNTNEVHATNS